MSITKNNTRMLDGSISDSQLASGVGTSANNLVKLDGTAKLPAVDGSQLTGISSGVKNIAYVAINPFTLSGGTAQFPRDNTIPLITEGASVIQHNYTPVSSSSTIFVSAYFSVAESSNVGNAHTGVLFFNDACVNARAVFAQPSGNGGMANMHLQASFSNTTGNVLDIEIRADNVGDAYTINGQNLNAGGGDYTVGTSAFGGANATSATYITITEI